MKYKKYKLTAALFFAVCAAVLFCGCGLTRVSVSPVLPTSALTEDENRQPDPEISRSLDETLNFSAPSSAPAASPSPTEKPVSSGVYYSPEDTRSMSNYMLGGRFVHDGKVLYGSRHDENGDAYLSRMKFTAGSGGMYVRESEAIETGLDARYLYLSDEYLFYLRTDSVTEKTSIIRYALGEELPEKRKVLYSGTCDYFFMRGDTLYFTDGDNHLMSMDTDGGSLKQLVSDKEIFFPYLISDELLLFQDDADGETLHIRHLPTSSELRLTDERTYEYVLSGTDLYWSGVSDEFDDFLYMRSRLRRSDLSEVLSGEGFPANAGGEIRTMKSELYKGTAFSINGSHINGSNFKTVPLDSWYTLSDNQYETGFTAACQYVSDSFEIFYDYDDAGLINRMLFYEPAFKRASYIELG